MHNWHFSLLEAAARISKGGRLWDNGPLGTHTLRAPHPSYIWERKTFCKWIETLRHTKTPQCCHCVVIQIVLQSLYSCLAVILCLSCQIVSLRSNFESIWGRFETFCSIFISSFFEAKKTSLFVLKTFCITVFTLHLFVVILILFALIWLTFLTRNIKFHFVQRLWPIGPPVLCLVSVQ